MAMGNVVRPMLDFERVNEPLLERRKFLMRVRRHLSYSGLLVLGSLIAGTAGFMATMRVQFLDAFLNASMLLGGMGPVGPAPTTAAGKIFASLYALYAGLVFLIVASFLFAPVFHRVLHRFHIERQDSN